MSLLRLALAASASAVVVVAVVAACDGATASTVADDSGSDGSNGSDAGVPSPRPLGPPPRGALPPGRISPEACSDAGRAPSNGAPSGKARADGGFDECALDVECTKDNTGRCHDLVAGWTATNQFKSLGNRCTYHECISDEACGQAVPCGCGVGFADQHVCLVQSACVTNADCTAGEICALSTPFIVATEPGVIVDGGAQGSFTPNARGELLGYFCTSPADECAPGQVPAEGAPDYSVTKCVYAALAGRWQWNYQP